MADRFRLLDLNEDCVKTVLQCFDAFVLISFSLCSKKRLANVRSLKLQTELHLYCGNDFYASFDFGGNDLMLFFCEDNDDGQDEELDETPRALKVDYIEGFDPLNNVIFVNGYVDHVVYEWRKTSFSGNDWIRHIMSVFNCDRIESLSVMSSKFEIASLVDTVRNLSIFKYRFPETISKEHILELLNALPYTEELDVHSLTFHTPSEYAYLLRNYQSLTVRTRDKITLDIVLSVNSLAFTCFEWPTKDVNRFIKLWQKGANPRMRYLYVVFFANHAGSVVFNENEVLRGVQYQIMPPGPVKIFEMPGEDMEIDGGFDIVGKNGRKATVTLENEGFASSFRMLIWQ